MTDVPSLPAAPSHILTRYADNNEHAPRTGGQWYRSTPLGVFNTADHPMVLIEP